MGVLAGALAVLLALPLTQAQFPAVPSNVTIINSSVNSAVTISFKETNICENTAGVKSYSGFVHLPGTLMPDIGGYDINTYFIYFEARNNSSTAPLAIYLAGGPGESSIYTAMSSENGPCYVDINGTDTVNNPWSFNNNANVLYIDQPSQTGFSYGQLANATFDVSDQSITPFDFQQSSPPTVNASLGYGTFASQNPNTTANNTVQAARALWYFAEHWLSSFPMYSTQSNKISIWGNSYGGYWVPETAAQYAKNLKNLTAAHPLESKNITLDAIGITNGCVDFESGGAGWPIFAYNNTYGIRYGSEELYDTVMQNLTSPGGCMDLVKQCRALGQVSDPDYTGSNATVNALCTGAFYTCAENVIEAFPELNERVVFDIAIPAPDPCPFYLPVSTYLNNGTVQQSLGVPLNQTVSSNIVLSLFGLDLPPNPNQPLSASTGDAVRQNGLPNIEYLLSNNVKVAFIFGDRDYRCPWTGGEATALAANWTHQSDFSAAGYEELQGVTTPITEGGLKAVVKQYGLFSFSRVLDAGHSVSAYAPETVYRIFDRTLRGVDVFAGNQSADGYQSSGPRDSWGWRNTLPANLPPTCMVEGTWTDSNPWQAILEAGN